MLVNETSAAAFPLTRFRDLACVPEKRARVPSSARVPGFAHPSSSYPLFLNFCSAADFDKPCLTCCAASL